MSCLVSSILLITLSLINIATLSRPQGDREDLKVALTAVNLRGMPVKMNTAEATENIASFDIQYSMTNFGTEPILAVYLRLFIVDSTGKLIKVRNISSGEKIEVGLTKVDQSGIRDELKESNTYFIAVNRVITPSGVWFVKDRDLTSAVKAKINKRPENEPAVIFEPNATTSDEDRSQIFELILRDILRDRKKSDMLKDPSKLILLRDSVSFNLPDNLPARLLALDKEEIQALAEVEGRVVYLVYEPLRSEGSQIGATILLRDTFPRDPSKIHFCFHYIFSFDCVKENGRWIVRKSVGIA